MGGGTRSATNHSESPNGTWCFEGDYFWRSSVTGEDLPLGYSMNLTGVDGSYHWRIEDTDSPNAPCDNDPDELVWTGIDIANRAGMTFTGYFAGREGSFFEDGDVLNISYRIDTGGWVDGLQFGVGTADTGLAKDGDFNGSGEGTVINHTLAAFSFTIQGTGDELDLRVLIYGSGGSEEVAFDNFSIDGELLPVELTNFTALVNGDGALLEWTTLSERDNAGFEIQQEVGMDFHSVGFVDGNGTSSEIHNYRYRVSGLEPGVHRFRLKQIDFDGSFEYSGSVEVVATLPDRFLIEPAYPNPFNPATALRFAVAADQNVNVTLVNALGKQVQTLFTGFVTANEVQSIRINAVDLPSGLYLVQFLGRNMLATERIVLSK